MESKLGLACFSGSIEQLVAWAQGAEGVGFDSIWVSEFYDRSATIPLAAMAIATTRIGLGSGIAYAFGRTPLVLAAEAADLDRLSGGRLLLGLGTGTKRMMQDWHGLGGDRPVDRIAELVPLLRQLWQLEAGPVRHEGKFYRTVVVPTNPLKAPVRSNLPIFLAGVNSRMLRAVGAVADGLVGHPLYTPEYVAEVVRPALAAGAESSDRSVPEIAGFLICSVDDDTTTARRRAAAQIGFYATTKTYRSMLEHGGFGAEVDAIRSAWQSGDYNSMANAVSDRMIDAIALAGTPEEVRQRYEQRWKNVYERALLYPPNFGVEPNVDGILRTFANTAPPGGGA